jgi:alcohol dehydrogenase
MGHAGAAVNAAVMRAFGAPLEVERVDDPEPEPDGVVVEVRATGVCRSDWHAWMGHDPAIVLPHVPGHELAGVVAAAGPRVHGFREGDRVTAPFCCGCGSCEQCRHGHTQICDVDYQVGFTAWGSFAQLVAIPRADLNVVALPDELGFVEAASLGCRFITAFAAVTEHGRVAAGDWVAVHGCGGVGLSVVMLAAALGAGVVAVDVDEATLTLARSLGAAHTVDARASDPAEAVAELTGGGAHVSIDALGSAATCRSSIRCLRKRGRHVQVGLMLEDERETAIPIERVISYELELRGVHGMAVGRYDALLRLIASGAVEPGRLIGRTIGLEDAGAELAAMGGFAQRGVTVVEP